MSSSAKRLAARARKAQGEAAERRKRQRNDSASPAPTPPRTAPRPRPTAVADSVLAAERNLSHRLEHDLWYDPPTTHVYDPFKYAWDAHEWYTREYGNSRKEVLLVEMSPSYWGMAQTGIPFGDVSVVRDYLKMPLSVSIKKPDREHAKRPVTGMDGTRADASGRRLWHSWARAAHGEDPHAFFERFFVYTYCPLLLLDRAGRVTTPNLMHPYERQRVTGMCDDALRDVVRALRPRLVVGVGGWALERARFALKDLVAKGLLIGPLVHPSPTSRLSDATWASGAKHAMQGMIAEMSASEDVWVPKAKGDSS